MKKCIIFIMLFFIAFSASAGLRYSHKLCKSPDFFCIKIKRGQSWERLWPNPEERDIVMRVNRMNIPISPGMKIAVPRNLSSLTVYDVSPFPRYIDPPKEKTIYVSQKELAWGAYDANGELVWWGPISSGRSFCADINMPCETPTGDFRIIRKQGIECVSTKFPIETDGGAPMPYCMHFYNGYALHGSYAVPGYPDSHGCIRLFIEDARWLNMEFIELPGHGSRGTRVFVNEP